MPWQRRMFKGNKVYARIEKNGELEIVGGRAVIRYQLNDPRVYKAAADKLEPLTSEQGGDKVWEDEEAVAADPQTGAGKKHARKAPDAPFFGNKTPTIIYTDGACSGNPGPAGIGIVMTCGERRKEVSEFLGSTTNNVAELTAIKRALELVKDPRRTIILNVDSQYSIRVLEDGNAKANRELIGSIKELMARFPDLRLNKVPAHSGVPENERCDQLAREAISNGKGG